MPFYGSNTQAESLAGTISGTVTIAMQDFINSWIDENIRQDGFVVLSADEYYDIQRSGQTELLLKHFPVITVTSIEDGCQNTTPESLVENEDYVVDKDTGIVQLLYSYSSIGFEVGANQVRVKYSYGYSAVPSDIYQIATMMAAKWAKIRDQQTDADGLKQVKIGDYQETRDISFMGIKSEFDDLLDPMVKKAKAKYGVGA